MGSLLSRATRERNTDSNVSSTNAFRYPSKSGVYFANQFIMGGERFDSPQPEAFLFGENSDLNFLNGKPVPFPYSAPSSADLARPLKCVINIRRESLRLVRILNDYGIGSGYNLEFNFDADVPCTIRIIYFAKEDFVNHTLSYAARDVSLNSEKYSYKAGADQLFNQSSHIFDPSKFPDDELIYSDVNEIIPVVLQCQTEDDEETVQSHATLAVIEKSPDGTYSLKALKQKLCIDGLCYLLQEVYGIENKTAGCSEYDSGDEEYEESGGDCVVCMSDARDTLILPCRHLCLCNGCAESLRYQANNCPICRAPFRALLQIRSLQKKETGAGDRATTESEDNVPFGYEVVSLIEALNGPSAQCSKQSGRVQNVDSPTLTPNIGGPRNRKRPKKVSIPKLSSPEISTSVVIQPSSPVSSTRSGSFGVASMARDKMGVDDGNSSRVVDHIEVVSEVAVRAKTTKRMDEEEDGKDSDQTTDSASSARSFNVLLRHGSQESVNEADLETPSPVGVSQE